MICDDCKEKPASVHITQINNNQKTEKHLCELCAQKSGEINFSAGANFSGVQDLLKGMFSQGNANPPCNKIAPVCPNCGMTYCDFGRNGKIGCSICFTTFGEQFEPLLRRIHGSSRHTGKIPKRTGGKLALKQKLRQLRRDLEGFVNREEYEQAARVRDEIKTFEQELKE